MADILANIENDFETERLVYLHVEPTDPAYIKTLTEMLSEPALQALSSQMILRPQCKKDIDFLAEQYHKSLLGVAVCLKPKKEGDAPEHIGTLCIGWGGIPASLRQNNNAGIGITLHKNHRGKGYGREALQWGVDWAFRHANLHMLELWVYAFNTNAIALYKSMGFEQTGIRKEAFWMDRKYHDELIFCMTEDEWEAKRKN